LLRRTLDQRWLAALAGVALLAGCIDASSPGAAVNRGTLSTASGSDRPDSTGADSDAACIETSDEQELARQILTLVNIERAKVGVDPLTWNDSLGRAAQDYSCIMAFDDFFAHFDPNTGDGPAERVTDAGYEFFGVGENLAAGQTSAAEAVEDWMNSPGHRENLLSAEWRETGIGVHRGGSMRFYWVQEFGKPLTRSVKGKPVARTVLTQASPSAAP